MVEKHYWNVSNLNVVHIMKEERKIMPYSGGME